MENYPYIEEVHIFETNLRKKERFSDDHEVKQFIVKRVQIELSESVGVNKGDEGTNFPSDSGVNPIQ